MSEEIRFFEVGPRDGLQNEKTILEPASRVEMVEGLVAAGVEDIEIGSFVHPKWVPQMKGTDEVAQKIERKEGVRYWALVPNRKGLKRAMDVGVDHVAVFMSATESHNKKNLNRTREQSLHELGEVIGEARSQGLVVRAYVSTAFGCPFEGEVDFQEVLRIGEELLDSGAEHLSLGDTIGVGSPPEIAEGCRRALQAFGVEKVALHLHDTQGLALANALVAYQQGVRLFDGAVGGMGGCPYAPGAAGNVASEDMINLFRQMDTSVGIKAEAICEVAEWLRDELGFRISGRYCDYWRAHRESGDE